MSAEDTILDYLRSQNRPYNVNDIFNNLHKGVAKPAAQKALDTLTAQGCVIEKSYGKQKIYFINQNNVAEVGQEELSSIDAKISALNDQYKDELRIVQEKEKELAMTKSMPSIIDLKNKTAEFNQRIAEDEVKLDQMATSGTEVDVAELRAIKLKEDARRKEWQKRRRICMNMVNVILEGYPKSKNDLLEEVGLEQDP